MSAYLRVCCDVCGRDMYATSTKDLFDDIIGDFKVQHVEFYHIHNAVSGERDYVCTKCYEKVIKEYISKKRFS